MIELMKRSAHSGMDAIMCAVMNTSQWRLRHHAVTHERLEKYLVDCEGHNHRSYYATPDENRTLPLPEWKHEEHRIRWNTPIPGHHPENNSAHAIVFDTTAASESPTIILLHALMSAHDFGYRRIAARFNRRGWNVLFPHLPYHYSRTPRGFSNGSLTITSDLIRNAEALRQSVIELRQLMAWSRERGSKRIALLATSYGAWVASLAISMEKTDFTILLQPITDAKHATFGSPASRMMAELLNKNGIRPESLDRHAHLSAPSRLSPLTPMERITIIGGKYDRISPSKHLKSLCVAWGGARYREVEQGHFGYGAMRCALEESEGYLKSF
jgi:hypothetical protein